MNSSPLEELFDDRRHYKWFRYDDDKIFLIAGEPDENGIYLGSEVFEEDGINFYNSAFSTDIEIYKYKDEKNYFIILDARNKIRGRKITIRYKSRNGVSFKDETFNAWYMK